MTTQYLFDDIKRDEGVRLKAYKDGRGIWTIGIGHNIEADPSLHSQLSHLIHDGITLEQAKAIFEHDVASARLALDLHIPWWKEKLNDARQDVLVNMCFNMGCAGVLGFHHMLASAQRGDWEAAAREMLSPHWISQVGDRARRLSAQMKAGVR